MRTYEALFIVQPNAVEEEVQSIVQGVEALVTQHEGSVIESEVWGKRRLAYEVKKFMEGIFVLMRFECPHDLVTTLETQFKLNDEVIRNLVVHLDAQTLRLEAEQKLLNAAALERRGDEGPDRDRDSRGRRSGPRTAERSEKREEPKEEPVEA